MELKITSDCSVSICTKLKYKKSVLVLNVKAADDKFANRDYDMNTLFYRRINYFLFRVYPSFLP